MIQLDMERTTYKRGKVKLRQSKDVFISSLWSITLKPQMILLPQSTFRFMVHLVRRLSNFPTAAVNFQNM